MQTNEIEVAKIAAVLITAGYEQKESVKNALSLISDARRQIGMQPPCKL
jgi:hypothetical protein